MPCSPLSHGVASFSEIARVVAANWKSIDAETLSFITAVSGVLKAYVAEHGIKLGDSSSPKAKKSEKPPKDEASEKDAEPNKALAEGPPGSLSSLGMPAEAKALNEVSGPFGSVGMPLKILDPLPLPLPLYTGNGRIISKDDLRSNTQRVSNASEQMQIDENISTTFPLSLPGSGGGNDVVNNAEQSFLQQVLGADVAGPSGQPQSITDLLSSMNCNSMGQIRQPRSSSLPGGMTASMVSQCTQQRSSSLPDISADATAPSRRGHHPYRRASTSNMTQDRPQPSPADAELGPELPSRRSRNPNRRATTMSSSWHGPPQPQPSLTSDAGLQQHRLASSINLGSCPRIVAELDMEDSEIFAMWLRE